MPETDASLLRWFSNSNRRDQTSMNIDISKTADADWDDFVRQHPDGTIYHLSAVHKVIYDTFGHETLYLCARRRGEIVGGLPIVHMKSWIFGNMMVSVPFFNYGGILCREEEARQALLQSAAALARKHKVSYIEFRHKKRRFVELPSKTHKVTMLLKLPDSSEALWQGFRAKLRSQIRRPEKDGIYVKIGGRELLDDFYSVFAVNMRDLGTPVYSKRLFANMLKYCGEQARIVAAYKERTPLAAGFVLGFKNILEIPWASSLRRYNRLAANMSMYWHALKYAIENGYGTFDFGRSSPDSGPYRFKRQWGAEPCTLHWEYWMANGGPLPDINPQNDRFRLAVRFWQKLPLSLTRLMGPVIVRNIP